MEPSIVDPSVLIGSVVEGDAAISTTATGLGLDLQYLAAYPILEKSDEVAFTSLLQQQDVSHLSFLGVTNVS